jgi:D-proline reductase (dithiol) PrdB
MADVHELSLPLQLFLKAYPWRRVDPVPWTPLSKPLSRCRVALVSSAGFVLPGQPPFDDGKRGGDPTFRQIDSDTSVRILTENHRSESFDHSGLRSDPNLAFPLDRVRELRTSGRIGEVNRRHLSFMGSLTAVGRFLSNTGPEAASWLVEDGVDVALLIPV